MERRTQVILIPILAVAGLVLLFVLTLYLTPYGIREFLLLLGILVALAIIETMIDDSTI